MDILALFLTLGRKGLLFHDYVNITCRFVADNLYQIKEVPRSSPSFLRVIITVLGILSSTFSASIDVSAFSSLVC